ncbi:type II secretion system F family protein [Zobellella denitrificans]|jgi:tight adherence protein C|uniref:type II secretion system F family protein n=1 Tax=Zobellella denitrificans TaxID=347534 RepID=UPI000BBE3FAA|nr:type II secretion system F family protein [Zobellella denitrificans]
MTPGSLALIILLLAAAMLLLWYRRRWRLRRQVLDRLDRELSHPYHRRVWHKGQSLWQQAKQPGQGFSKLARLMRQAGIAGNHRQLVFLSQAAAACLLLTLACMAWIFTREQMSPVRGALLSLLAALFSGYGVLLWLRARVRRRRASLDEELLLVLQVMRILWDVGMSMESLLRVMKRELARMAPESCREMELLLARIDAGEDREAAFTDLAAVIPSDGWQDLLRLLAQVSASGGGMSEALQRLGELLQDRRRTQLQEKVSKLSGRMSAVMIVFLFPALLIVLAGPGFLALGQALMNMR